MSQLNSKKPIPGKLTQPTRRPAKQLSGYSVINSLKVNILPLIRSAFCLKILANIFSSRICSLLSFNFLIYEFYCKIQPSQ